MEANGCSKKTGKPHLKHQTKARSFKKDQVAINNWAKELFLWFLALNTEEFETENRWPHNIWVISHVGVFTMSRVVTPHNISGIFYVKCIFGN